MVCDPLGGAARPPSAGPSSSGIGTAPVATACATTITPPSAPTVSTAAVAAVVVQSVLDDRLATPSTGRIRSRKYDSPRSTSDGDIKCEEDTCPSIAGVQFPADDRSHPLAHPTEH